MVEIRPTFDQCLNPPAEAQRDENRKSVTSRLQEAIAAYSREKGPALVGIELKNRTDFASLRSRMEERNFNCEYINDRPEFYHFII